MRPRLLFVVNVDWFFLSHRIPIAEAALHEGFEVHVACGITGLRKELEQRGLTVHELPWTRGHGALARDLRVTAQLVALMRDFRPDVIHLVTIKPVLLGGIAARLAGVRNVVAAVSGLGHVFVSEGRFATARRFVVRILYRLALGTRDVVAIFQNAADAKVISALAGLAPSQVRIISGSGVDLAKFSAEPLPAGSTVVTFAARLLKDKGLREFVEAAYLLRSEGVDAHFIAAGNVDPENPASVTLQQVENWKSDGIVEFPGHIDSIGQLFMRSHIVVLPSYREGFPKVLIEAAASGRAVVTTDVPGCRDAIIAGKTGILVPAASVEPLAAAMRELICDRDRCSDLGLAGRELAERAFGIDGVVEDHLRIYRELLERAA